VRQARHSPRTSMHSGILPATPVNHEIVGMAAAAGFAEAGKL